MDTIDRLLRAAKHPNLFVRGANRLYHRRLNRRAYNTDGVDIFEEDWDCLLILDACRYDMFKQHHDLPGQLESRTSRGSATVEFLRGNFFGKSLNDTVYVTANPQFYRNRERLPTELYDVVNIWQRDGWDEEHQTVLPETVNEYAKEAAATYPNKRLIIHYIQPHYPFLGSEGSFDKNHLNAENPDQERLWDQLMTGELEMSRDSIWQLYVDNLLAALPYVEELMTGLTGKVVVTADHGNMVGERASPFPITEWGHPRGMYTEQLVTVPWLTFENGPRRETVAEEPINEREDVDTDVVSERLADLGYID
ncbi:hypothetical protein DJ71_23875 [Halorubrum sp. E3]|nr:hypothetical protein DJ71_23875 [Halorubrum sp. E3]OYR83449.1 hypothetical protein DJ72_07325 [Halorubrum distributum]